LPKEKAIEKYKKWPVKRKSKTENNTDTNRRAGDNKEIHNQKINKDDKEEVKHAFFTSVNKVYESQGPVIILDTGANVALYKDKSLIYNIRQTEEILNKPLTQETHSGYG
jgi:hypothetical protein